MSEKINIVKGTSVTIRYGSGFAEETKASKSAFRISKTASSNTVVIHLDGQIAFRCAMSDITIQNGITGAPEQLTPANWDELTDGLNDSKGGAGGGDSGGDASAAIGAHNVSPTAHQDIRQSIANVVTALGDVYTKSEADGRFVEQVPGKGLSTNDFGDADKAKTDWIGSEVKSSLTDMDISRNLVIVSRMANDNLTIHSVAVDDAAFCIIVIALAAVSIAVPTGDVYVNMSDAIYSLAANDVIEIHGFKNSITGYYHFKVLTR